MFESSLLIRTTEYSAQAPYIDHDYYKCWQDLPCLFDPNDPTPK
jgi:homogentisate 1,2-dioxygenase